MDDGAADGTPPDFQSLTWVAGEKPFIFARNANIGLRKAFETSDAAILLNDDALLMRYRGFTSLYRAWQTYPQYGLLSGACTYVGNENQLPQSWAIIRQEPRMLCFIAVLIPRAVFEQVGPLDEQYCLDYGVEDGDYCYRVRQAGYQLGVWDSCVVDHSSLKSSYRSDGHRSFAQNAALFEQKWGVVYGTE